MHDQIRYLFILASLLGLLVVGWLAMVVIWLLLRSRRRQHLADRLHAGVKSTEKEKVLRLWHDGQSVEMLVPGQRRRSFLEYLDTLRQDAGWRTSMPQILLLLLTTLAIAALLLFLLTNNWLLVSALVAAVLIVFRGYMLHCIARRTALFEKQLVDALELGGRSLRAGHPLSGAFRLIAQETAAPLNAIFAEIVDQESFGISLQQALDQAAKRSRSPDMMIFATSVVIQLRSGGNLADMMDRVSWVVRDRMRLNRRARTLTAEAQLSKWVLLALPIVLFVVLCILNPGYMDPFFSSTPGRLMLIFAAISVMLGAWMMNQMVKLKY